MKNSSYSGMVTATMKSSKTAEISQDRLTQARFVLVYQEHAIRVYRYIFARVGNHPDSEDLTAQVFMDALKGWHRFSKGGNVAAWLFTIARNKIVDRHRKIKKTVYLEDIPDITADSYEPLQGIIDKETARQLTLLLQKLSPDQQELLHLRFAGELTYAQIAEVLGKSESAVKMAIHRLLKQLQENMEQDNA